MPALLETELALLLKERVDVDHFLADEIVVHHHDAEDGPHGGADEADEVRGTTLPRREGIEHQCYERCDIAAFLEVDLLWKNVGKVEGGRDEVCHHVDAKRGNREGQGREQSEEPAIELCRDLVGVQQHLAIDREGRRRRDTRHQREQEEVDRQAPDIALADRGFVGRIAREVAEVQVQGGEIGDPGCRHRRQ